MQPSKTSKPPPLVETVRAASFLDRLNVPGAAESKRLLGYYIATHLVKPGDGMIVLSGTTPCFAAEQVMSTVEDVSIFTTSIPVLWAGMKLNHVNRMARGVALRALGGDTHLLTGTICNSNFRSCSAQKLIYSPRSLTVRGIEGNRDIDYIQAGLAASKYIILPVTDDKLDRRADVVIKHLGHIARESRNNKRRYTILLPYASPAIQGQTRSILGTYQDAGVEVIRLPRDFALPKNASNIFSTGDGS